MSAAGAGSAAAAAAARAAARFAGLSSSSSSSSSRGLLAVRAFNSSSSSCLFPRRLLQPAQQQQQQQLQRGFSSSAAAAAESLAAVIQKEIAHEKAQYEPEKKIKEFLETKKWQLQEKENDVLVTLTREVDGLKVTVEFSCIQPAAAAEEEAALPESSDFTVSVHRSDGSGLLFYCSTTAEDETARFCIGQVRHFVDSSSKESLASYPGPYFEDLDEAFQQQLDSWLAAVGVDGQLCDFLEAFAADKENRE
ncbi:mitochondrial glycoprotein domain-containing protein, putative, partial [Eimeria necatrix]